MRAWGARGGQPGRASERRTPALQPGFVPRSVRQGGTLLRATKLKLKKAFLVVRQKSSIVKADKGVVEVALV